MSLRAQPRKCWSEDRGISCRSRPTVSRVPSALAAPSRRDGAGASGTFFGLILPPILLEHSSVDVSRRWPWVPLCQWTPRSFRCLGVPESVISRATWSKSYFGVENRADSGEWSVLPQKLSMLLARIKRPTPLYDRARCNTPSVKTQWISDLCWDKPSSLLRLEFSTRRKRE